MHRPDDRAAIEIAERADWSLWGGPVDAELLTPTGAAILGHFADGVDELPSIALEASGYGGRRLRPRASPEYTFSAR